MGVRVDLRAAPPAAKAQFPAKVMLVPFRGGHVSMARNPADRLLDLLIDTRDLAADIPATAEYSIGGGDNLGETDLERRGCILRTALPPFAKGTAGGFVLDASVHSASRDLSEVACCWNKPEF